MCAARIDLGLAWFCDTTGAGAEGQLSPAKDEEVTRRTSKLSICPALFDSGQMVLYVVFQV